MEESIIPLTYQGVTIWSTFLYSGWSGFIALGVLFFYSIPMGVMGIKNPKKRALFVLKSDAVCRFLIAVFFMFAATAIIEQFYPSLGMDDRCFQLPKKITSIASSAFFVSLTIAVTQLIKILSLKNKNSKEAEPTVKTPVE